MAPQQRLELGRRDLEPLVLDQLLQPIDDREVPVPVDAPDISRVQPPGGVERGRRGLRVVQVSRHYLRAADQELPVLVRPEVGAGRRIYDPALGIRHQRSHRSWLALAGLVRIGVGHRARLGESVPLNEPASQTPGTCGLEVGLERCRAGHHRPQARQIVAVHGRMLGEREHERWHHERPGDAILLHGGEERLQLEPGHGDEGRATPQRQVQHHLHPVDVEERQDRDDAILLRHMVHRGCLEQVGHEIAMRQHHALGESRGAARVRQYREIPRRVDRSARGRRGGLEQGRERRGAGRAAQNEDLLDAHLLRDWRGPIHE